MKTSNRQLFRHLHLLLVSMLVLSSIVSGASHAVAMAAPGAFDGGAHHAAMASATDHSMVSHPNAGDVQTGSDEQSQPAGSEAISNPCSPVVCSCVPCWNVLNWDTIIVPHTYEIVAMFRLIAANMILPERPPRV